jgi:hypothetical protein
LWALRQIAAVRVFGFSHDFPHVEDTRRFNRIRFFSADRTLARGPVSGARARASEFLRYPSRRNVPLARWHP